MWDGAEHRKRSIAQVASFARFRDNLSRPMSQFLPLTSTIGETVWLSRASVAHCSTITSICVKVFNHAVDERVINTAPRIKFFLHRVVFVTS